MAQGGGKNGVRSAITAVHALQRSRRPEAAESLSAAMASPEWSPLRRSQAHGPRKRRPASKPLLGGEIKIKIKPAQFHATHPIPSAHSLFDMKNLFDAPLNHMQTTCITGFAGTVSPPVQAPMPLAST
jgi:hypothetical protein